MQRRHWIIEDKWTAMIRKPMNIVQDEALASLHSPNLNFNHYSYLKVLAIVIAWARIFANANFTENKKKEIGIRKVLAIQLQGGVTCV